MLPYNFKNVYLFTASAKRKFDLIKDVLAINMNSKIYLHKVAKALFNNEQNFSSSSKV